MSTRTLRAGLVGLGHMGRHHARALRRLPGVDLVAVVDPAGDPTGVCAGVDVHTDLDAMLRRGVDYAVLACPTSLHADVGVQLAAAGVPTLIEKPLAPDASGARRLVDAFAAAGVPAGVGYIERFHPALTELRARLQAGELGDVFDVSTRRTSTYPARIADVGVIDDLATHDIDLTAWLTGQPYTSITARTAYRTGRPHEDLLAAIAQLADGTIAQHRVSWVAPARERLVTVTGEHGCLTANTLTSDLTFHRNAAWGPRNTEPAISPGAASSDVTAVAVSAGDALLNEHRAFRNTVLGHSTATAGLHAGLHAVLVAQAAAASAPTALTVAIAA